MTAATLITHTALTHATTTQTNHGEWQYVIWAIGTGLLQPAYANTTLPRTLLP